jgi:hypothetical protein
MSASVRDSFTATTFVRGGEQGAISRTRTRKGDVNTSYGAAAFTAEESTSFYGNLVGLPANVRLKEFSSARASEISNFPTENSDRVPSGNLSESNIGFQLLKKSGWKEGTGLGATEQGRLDPVETQLKQDRRGIGADLKRKRNPEERRRQKEAVRETEDVKKEKVLSKKARKALAQAEREREHALASAFYREFWPENV